MLEDDVESGEIFILKYCGKLSHVYENNFGVGEFLKSFRSQMISFILNLVSEGPDTGVRLLGLKSEPTTD